MSDPFEYLEEEAAVAGGGIGWMPISLAGLVMAGSLAVPTVGFLKRKESSNDWSKYAISDPLPVAVASVNSFESLLTPNPEDLQLDLASVDETLGGLGEAVSKAKIDSSTDVPPLKEKVALRKPTPISKVKSRPGGPSYPWTVKKGETLYGIGRKTGASPQMIAKTSGINLNDPIVPGQVLQIPGHRPVQPTPIEVSGRAGAYPGPTDPAGVGMWADPIAQEPVPLQSNYPDAVLPSQDPTTPSLFPNTFVESDPNEATALPKDANPLDRYSHAIAYRVQFLDNINRIADAHAISAEELIETNGRSKVKQGEMLVVPVDNCLIKSGH